MTAASTPAAQAAPPPFEGGLDLASRVHLAHACIARAMADAAIRGLHVKGYAMSPGVYVSGRSSSDVDLLVPPGDAERACALLEERGWKRVTDFSEGSIFQHAATFWHTHLGYVDVHRLFPGLGTDPNAAFERLWADHGTRVIAGRPIAVPSITHQRLVVVVHGARDPGRGAADVAHLRRTLTSTEWAAVREEAVRLDAGAAWTVATGDPVADVDGHDLWLFQALADHETGVELFATRWRAERTAWGRARLVLRAIPVNRPHLRMRLGRPLTFGDIVRAQVGRSREAIRWVRGAVSRRG